MSTQPGRPDTAPSPGPSAVPGAAGLGGELGFRLSRLARNLRSTWAEELAAVGLTPPQAAVLRGVQANPGTGVRALARHLGSDPMNVKRCADGLEHDGLLASGHDPGDRRPRTLRLTARGRSLAARVARMAGRREDHLGEVLGPGGRRALVGALARLEADLGLEPGPGRRSAGAAAGTASASPTGGERR